MPGESDDGDDRRKAVAEALREVLRDGEQFVVRRSNGDIEVVPPASRLKETNPRLYGQLLSLDQDVSDAGSSTLIVMLLASIGVCVGIHLGWFDVLVGEAFVAQVRSWVFYVLTVVAAFVLGGFITNRLEVMAYRRGRDLMVSEMRVAGIDRSLLVTMIAEDKSLSHIAEHVKRDRDADIEAAPK